MSESNPYCYPIPEPTTEYADQAFDEVARPPRSADATKRSLLSPLIYGPAVAIMGIAWASKSLRITDFGFILLSVAAVAHLLNELWRFSARIGIGAMIVSGGSLIWFCDDYFKYWYGAEIRDVTMPADVIAKAGFYYAVFVMSLTAGLLIPWGKFFERLIIGAVPEPNSSRFYLVLVFCTLAIGLSPYVFFTSEPFYVSIYREFFRGYTTEGAHWTLTGENGGNVTKSWGFYVMFLFVTGRLGGVLAAFYAMLVARSVIGRIVGWAVWAFWSLLTAGGGVRGDVAFTMLPVAALLFIKYQAGGRRFSVRAYLFGGLTVFTMVFIFQFIARFRESSFLEADVSQVEVTNLQGNNMFTDALVGFALIPDTHAFFYNRFPMEGAIRLIPNVLIEIIIHPIPRPLWPDKPIDPAFLWYNLVTRGDELMAGNVSHGGPGYWYFRYGFWGVVEGGMLMGWIMAISERALRQSGRRPMAILMSLGVAVWMFRCFRGFAVPLLYHLIVAAIVLRLLVAIERRLTAPRT